MGPLLLLLTGCGWVHGHFDAERDARVATLQALPAEQMAKAQPLDRDAACRIAELHLLQGGTDGALGVDCSEATLTEQPGGAYTLAHVLAHRRPDEVWLGDGGFRRSLCLVPTDHGWHVMGHAYALDECAFQTLPGAPLEVQRQAAVQGIEAARAQLATTGLEALRAAIDARPATLPDTCSALPEVPARHLVLVDQRSLQDPTTKHPADFTTGAVLACLGAETPAECAVHEPWTHALYLEPTLVERPVSVDRLSFTGGSWRGSVTVVDLTSRTALCQRPLDVQLRAARYPEADFPFEVARHLCDALEQLSAGSLTLDPYWRCD